MMPCASARLAREAVTLNPNLLWVYAAVAVRHPELAEIAQWIPQLERWDPQNALFPLITVESIDIAHVTNASKLSPREEERQLFEGPAWQSAMAAAFASFKLDDYLDRSRELDRRVMARYRLNDPYELLSAENYDLPSYAYSDSQRFAKSLLQSGRELESRGDRQGAREKYWAVARFGQAVDTPEHREMGTALQAMAYKELEALSEKEGNSREAALFRYFAAKFDPVRGEQARLEDWLLSRDIVLRNAAVLQISSLAMLIFAALLALAAGVLLWASRRGAHLGIQRAQAAGTLVGLTSAVGLLLSSATLYLTYRPYWYIFQSISLHPGQQSRDLLDFLSYTKMPPWFSFPPHGGLFLYSPSRPGFLVYFWTGVTLLGLMGLALIAARHLMGRPHAHAP